MRKLEIAMLAMLLLTSACAAQETETERQAAPDVVRQIQQLEQSLDVPSMVAKLTAPDKNRDEVVARVKQLMQTDLLPMSDWITQHPEIGFTETRAVAKLTAYLQAHDFDVTPGVADLPTAFVAKYRRGTPGPESRCHRRIRRSSRHKGRIPWRSAQRARPCWPRRRNRDVGISHAYPHAGHGHCLRHARRGNDAS